MLQYSAFYMDQLSHLYMTTGKTIALIIWTFVGKMMSLLFNTLFRFVRASRWLNDKESTCLCRRRQRLRFDHWVRKIPCRRKWEPVPVFLLEKSHGEKKPGGLQSMGSQELGHDSVAEHILRTRFVMTFLPRSKSFLYDCITSCSDFGAQKNKICHCFHFFPFYLP